MNFFKQLGLMSKQVYQAITWDECGESHPHEEGRDDFTSPRYILKGFLKVAVGIKVLVWSTKETFISSEKKVQQNVSWLEVIVHEVHFAVIRSYRSFCTEGGPEGPPWVPLGVYF